MAASHQSAWAVPDGIHCPDLEEPAPQGATPLVILAIVPGRQSAQKHHVNVGELVAEHVQLG